jgi:hypothetical protein
MLHNTGYDIEEHRYSATRHSIMRAKERLHVEMSTIDVMKHGLMIWAGQTTRVGLGAARRELHAIDDALHGRSFLAVWDGRLRRIVTYLDQISEWKGTLTPDGRNLLIKALPTTERRHGPESVLGARQPADSFQTAQ